MIPPLPLRHGVAPSFIWLQKGTWKTVLAFLIDQFPHISRTMWLSRMARGEVVDEMGKTIDETSSYFWGKRLFYYREIDCEPIIPFEEQILFQDDHILVVDKPHFLPVIPSGNYLHETLLVRLKNKHGLPHLSPIHRLDRETAGVMIFSVSPNTRGSYQSLFQQRAIVKEYEALAPHSPILALPLRYRSCLKEGIPFYLTQEVPGTPNSETHIELIEQYGDISRYRLKPVTGKKHQLRVHLASLGIPILNDSFYPINLPPEKDNFSNPLQLVAKSIAFLDPITKQERFFESKLKLKFTSRA